MFGINRVDEFELGLGGTLDRFEALQVLTADGREDGIIRRYHTTDFFDLPSHVGTHLADEVIQFFNNVVPDDFVDDKNTHNREQTREAVRTLLKLHDRDQIGDRIEAFEHWKTESDRPQVKTVLEFCTDKLALVEGYIAEKGYVLRYG